MPGYNEQMQRIWRKYEASGNDLPVSAHTVAQWAVRTGLWGPRPADVINQCATDLAKALREEYFTDQKGRRVRAKHAARIRIGGEQLALWADIRSAPRTHMELAFQQRRRHIVGECRQLKLDVDSYNDSQPEELPIQMVFDFTRDLEELEQDAA